MIAFTRSLDPTRPVTFVTAAAANTDHAVRIWYSHSVSILLDFRLGIKVTIWQNSVKAYNCVCVSLQQVQYVDVILRNSYYAWYQDPGQTQLISRQLEIDLRAWFDKFHKPVVQSEYGADTVAGLHTVSC